MNVITVITLLAFVRHFGYVFTNTTETSSITQDSTSKSVWKEPNTPRNVTCKNRRKNSLTISWESSSEDVTHGKVSSYMIQSNQTSLVTTTDTSYTFFSLMPCTDYCFEISAHSNFGQSKYSIPKCFDTTAPNVEVVSMNKADNKYSKERNISWRYLSQDKCGIQFVVEYGLNDQSSLSMEKTTNARHILLTNLILSSMYKVRVRAISLYDTENGKKNGSFSEDVYFNTDKKPDIPSNVKIGKRTKDSLTISWESSSEDVTHGKVSSYMIKSNHTSLVKTKDTSYTFSSLMLCTDYCFEISAHSNFGQSEYSNSKCFDTTAPNVAVVSMNKPDDNYGKERNISWSYPSQDKCGIQFVVEYGLNDQSSLPMEKTTNARHILLTNLILSSMYKVRVRAISLYDTENGKKNGTFSEDVYFNTDKKPDIPSNVKRGKRTKDSLTISWKSSSENVTHGKVSSYTIKSNHTSLVTTADTSYTFSSLMPCTDYCFEISAHSNFGQSAYSNSKCFYTTAPNVAVVTMNTVDNKYSNERNISWSYPSQDKCTIIYLIEYKLKDNDIGSSRKTTGRHILLTDLSLSTTYKVRVKAQSLYVTEDGIKMGEYSDYVSFTTDQKPDTPSNVTIVTVSTNSLYLTWHSPNADKTHSIKGYTIRYNDLSNFTKERSLYIRQCKPCTKYCITITATNTFWESIESTPICITTSPVFSRVDINDIPSIYGRERNITWKYETIGKCNVRFSIKYKEKQKNEPWIITDTDEKYVVLKNLNVSRKYIVEIRAIPNHSNNSGLPQGNDSTASFFTGPNKPLINVSEPKYVETENSITVNWIENSTITQEILEYVVLLKNIFNKCFYRLRIRCKEVETYSVKVDCDKTDIKFCTELRGKIKVEGSILFQANLPVSPDIRNYTMIVYAVNYGGEFIVYDKKGKIVEGKSKALVVIILVLLLLALLLLCFIIMIIIRKKNMIGPKTHVRGKTKITELDSTFTDSTVMRNLIEDKMPKVKNQTGIANENNKTEKLSLDQFLHKVTGTEQQINNFAAYCEKMRLKQCTSLVEEYKKLAADSDALEKSLKLTKFTGKSPFNLKKNRFQNILPFDQNRVLVSGKTTSDGYINASFIPYSEDSSKVEFIASQGPIEATLSAFVLMIWEQNITCIVMLTQTYEDGKFKCIQYWPDNIGLSMQFGQNKEITILLSSEKETTSHFERIFTMKNIISNETRTIYHIHMHTWCDYSAPDSEHFYTALTRFHELMETACTAPFLIHCSAGVGRTGTFICLDRIVRKLNKGAQKVDIYKTVLELRAYRNFLVQRQAQYIFIHDFLDFFIKKFTSEKTSPTGDII